MYELYADGEHMGGDTDLSAVKDYVENTLHEVFTWREGFGTWMTESADGTEIVIYLMEGEPPKNLPILEKDRNGATDL